MQDEHLMESFVIPFHLLLTAWRHCLILPNLLHQTFEKPENGWRLSLAPRPPAATQTK